MQGTAKWFRTNVTRATVIASAAWLWPGCANDASCDPGYVVDDGRCIPVTAPEPGPEGGAAGAAADPSECGAERAATGTFGATCRDGVNHTDCACPAPICAVQPGADSGFCTQIHCDSDAALCPAGWSCFDLSAVDPSYPSTCVPE